MTATARLNLPYIAPLQAQKQVTYQTRPWPRSTSSCSRPSRAAQSRCRPAARPKATPSSLPPSASGAWAGKDGDFACWRDGGWRFRAPADGWLAYVIDEALLAVRQSGAWQSLSATRGL